MYSQFDNPFLMLSFGVAFFIFVSSGPKMDQDIAEQS